MPLKPATLLDSNAGAPLHPSVRRALFAFLEDPRFAGNPASAHAFGRDALAFIAEAEASVLKTFRVSPAEWRVTFTGSGTEANQLAVRTVLDREARRGSPVVWAVSEVEHSSVLDLVPEMERKGIEVRALKAAANGEVTGIESALASANLLSVIGAGNETGIIQQNLTSHILCAQTPLHKLRTPLHTDFIAGWGKARLDLSAADAPDLVAIAGHKLGGLAGAGALVHRKEIPVDRPGTPNLAGIASLKALADHWGDVIGEIGGLGTLRDDFEKAFRARFPAAVITGADLPRVPNVSHFRFPGLNKNLSLVAALDLRGFAVSAGSACASGAPEPSHVLRAMGLSELDARNALRVSLHRANTAAELSDFLDALDAVLKRNEAV